MSRPTDFDLIQKVVAAGMAHSAGRTPDKSRMPSVATAAAPAAPSVDAQIAAATEAKARVKAALEEGAKHFTAETIAEWTAAAFTPKGTDGPPLD